MLDKQWLDRVALGAKVYVGEVDSADNRMAEVLKFVEWLHRQYGIVYNRPVADSGEER
jgi:hypothetical protein